MRNETPKPKFLRKRNRLSNYDYSREGTYFITICTKGQQKILADTADVASSRLSLISIARPQLTEAGKIVESKLKTIADIYPAATIDRYVIMPNHIHVIIVIRHPKDGRAMLAATPTLSHIIQQYKGAVTKQLKEAIWQPSFYDRIIRNQEEYDEYCRYIAEKPRGCADNCPFIENGPEV